MSKPQRLNWVIANWKLNPLYIDAQNLYQALADAQLAEMAQQGCHTAIATPNVYLGLFASKADHINLVAQDISTVSGLGAYTGEISAILLADMGVKMTLIGHSERRELFGDDTEKLQQKIKNAKEAQFKIIFCVGESLAQREAGQAVTTVLAQLDELTQMLDEADWENVILAYEPIWAIGTGKTASASNAQDMHAAIRQYLKNKTNQYDTISILYGGSVKPENAVELATCQDIDGALVGGASLNANSFLSIVNAFAQS